MMYAKCAVDQVLYLLIGDGPGPKVHTTWMNRRAGPGTENGQTDTVLEMLIYKDGPRLSPVL